MGLPRYNGVIRYCCLIRRSTINLLFATFYITTSCWINRHEHALFHLVDIQMMSFSILFYLLFKFYMLLHYSYRYLFYVDDVIFYSMYFSIMLCSGVLRNYDDDVTH